MGCRWRFIPKASLFQTAPKTPGSQKQLPRQKGEPVPPTQIEKTLRKLGMAEGCAWPARELLAEGNRYMQPSFSPGGISICKWSPPSYSRARAAGLEHARTSKIATVVR
jgi:hypothetical protein